MKAIYSGIYAEYHSICCEKLGRHYIGELILNIIVFFVGSGECSIERGIDTE